MWSTIFVFSIFGYCAWISAAVAATRGAAIEVPFHVPYIPPGTVLVSPTPGDATRIQEPRVENDASLSCCVDAATAINPFTPSAAGYCSVKTPPLPAAATITRFGFPIA